jgi:hypothetical protein
MLRNYNFRCPSEELEVNDGGSRPRNIPIIRLVEMDGFQVFLFIDFYRLKIGQFLSEVKAKLFIKELILRSLHLQHWC